MSLEIASSPTSVETTNSAPIKAVRVATVEGRTAKAVKVVVPGKIVTKAVVSRTIKAAATTPGGLEVVKAAIRRNLGTVVKAVEVVVGVSRNVPKTPT